jgi:putative FmdB family regulatory protein
LFSIVFDHPHRDHAMPIYEYRCASCGHQLEALQKLSEAPLSTCPACSRDELKKLVSAAGFQLKGSGWYATDFKSNGSKPAKPAAGGGGEAKASESKGDAKSDAKGDAKSDAKGDAKSDAKSEAAAPTGCGANCGCH